jgi:CheY-like chemotaxis protein
MLAERHQPTILIAEDYDDNRELLRVLLVSASYNVHEARNGRECLELAKQNKPDLIMVDLSMPVLDGWALLAELKGDVLTAAIPCVAVTAHGEGDRQRALSAGFDGYASKPFHTSELYRVVRMLLKPVSQPEVC